MTLNILLHVLPPSISKILSIPGRIKLASRLLHQRSRQAHGARSIRPHALDTPRIHLLKPNNKHTIRRAVLYERSGEMQTRRARRARIVGVVDWDTCHTKLVEDALSGRRVALMYISELLRNCVVSKDLSART